MQRRRFGNINFTPRTVYNNTIKYKMSHFRVSRDLYYIIILLFAHSPVQLFGRSSLLQYFIFIVTRVSRFRGNRRFIVTAVVAGQ